MLIKRLLGHRFNFLPTWNNLTPKKSKFFSYLLLFLLDDLEKGIASAKSSLQKNDLKQEQRDYYYGRISENTELLPLARNNFEEAKRELLQFKRQNGLN